MRKRKMLCAFVLLVYCGAVANNIAAAASEPGISPVIRADARKMVFLVNREDATKIAFLTADDTDDSFCKSYQEQNPRLAYCGPAKGFDFDEAQQTFDVVFTEKIATDSGETGSTTRITIAPILLAASLAASAVGMRSVGQGLAAGLTSNPNSSWTTTTAAPPKEKPTEGPYFLYEVFERFAGNIKNYSRFRCKDGIDMVACRESWKALLLVQPQPAK